LCTDVLHGRLFIILRQNIRTRRQADSSVVYFSIAMMIWELCLFYDIQRVKITPSLDTSLDRRFLVMGVLTVPIAFFGLSIMS